METSESVQWPSFSFSKRKSEKSPLSKLKPQELESLGLKAVGEGADPAELQDAFAKAQVLCCYEYTIYAHEDCKAQLGIHHFLFPLHCSPCYSPQVV